MGQLLATRQLSSDLLAILFVLPLLFSLYVQYDENINKYDYWNYQVLKELGIYIEVDIDSDWGVELPTSLEVTSHEN